MVARLCRQHVEAVVCRPLGGYDAEGKSYEALQQLHAFCDARPAASSTPVVHHESAT